MQCIFFIACIWRKSDTPAPSMCKNWIARRCSDSNLPCLSCLQLEPAEESQSIIQDEWQNLFFFFTTFSSLMLVWKHLPILQGSPQIQKKKKFLSETNWCRDLLYCLWWRFGASKPLNLTAYKTKSYNHRRNIMNQHVPELPFSIHYCRSFKPGGYIYFLQFENWVLCSY